MRRKNKLQENKDFSLVVKMNSRLLWRLFRYFIVLDIVLIFLFLIYLIYDTEKGFREIYIKENLKNPTQLAELYESETKEKVLVGDFTVKIAAKPRKTIDIPSWLVPYSDKVFQGGQRYLYMSKNSGSVFENFTSLNYMVSHPYIGEQHLEIECAIGKDLRLFSFILSVLLILQGLMLLGAIGSGTRIIRNSLKPIYEIEMATRNLKNNTSVAELNALAGRIYKIEAQNLNSRISVDSAQEELKGLSDAINDLLERIEEAYRSQSRFVSDASHELRTPISVIQGYANLLDRWGKNDKKTMEESIHAIKNEADNMKDLVEQLLFLARGDNEAMAINSEVFNISLLVEEVYQESQMIDPNHEIGFMGEKQLFVDGDIQLIKQALRILVDNSIKYTPPGEKITVSIEDEKNSVTIKVQDNGIGMMPKDLPYIFDRFYRSDDSRARKTGGTGLGLSIAKWIIHRHGGHMEVMSRKDFGTRITVVLPFAAKVDEKK